MSVRCVVLRNCRSMTRPLASARAFTLIELLVTILVIAVLALIALPALLGHGERAHDTSVKSDLLNSRKAAKSIYVEHGQAYPAEQDLVAELAASEPQYRYVAYDAANPEATGATTGRISVERESAHTASMCKQSQSSLYYCLRIDETATQAEIAADPVWLRALDRLLGVDDAHAAGGVDVRFAVGYDERATRIVAGGGEADGAVAGWDPSKLRAPAGPVCKANDPTSYTNLILSAATLRHYWRFEEPNCKEGQEFTDAKGGATGTFTVGGERERESASSKLGWAVRFDGVDDYAEVPITIDKQSGVTVEFWMKTSAWTTANNSMSVSFVPDSGPGLFYMNLSAGMLLGNSRLSVARNGNVGTNGVACQRPSAGGWHHYVLHIYPGNSVDEAYLYIDGVRHSSADAGRCTRPADGSWSRNNTDSAGTQSGTLYIGSYTPGTYPANIEIDELAVYDGLLSEQTIDEHYAAGRSQ